MKTFTLIALTVFATLSHAADWNKIPANDYTLGPPPAKGSVEFERDFDVLLNYQATRTKQLCDAAAAQEHPDLEVMYKPSGLLTAKQLKDYAPLFDKVGRYAAKIGGKFKDEYLRPRPYNEDARIKPCISRPGGNKAYPSVHTTVASSTSCLLAALLPQKSEALLEYGHELGELRVIAGVHHPSDVQAGRNLGQQICTRLLQDEDFQKHFKKLH
ncbi:MAG: phosphatase PAP2 family protein [Bdellovibrionales bacterium]|nr:phosphatase PAP2 family protein [Bdellovibrionales bacterium]